ncbi:hypothetical protein L0Y59_01930, partial [Candidatus Uhrbacteria bacterium]|nr:hypothetical protein [Candidatus Uhrbacteria bacterium]
AAYSLLLTSQSGKTSRRIVSTVRFAAPWSVVWSRGTTSQEGDALSTLGTWDRDRVVSALITSGETEHDPHAQETSR